MLHNCSYNPHENVISTHINKLSESLDLFSADYEKGIILGDFNVEADSLKNLIKQPTCYKNPSNLTSIDLIFTNIP